MRTALLRETVDALSALDAEKLEELCAEAEALVAHRPEQSVQGAVEARALKQTLFELLRTTDENLRLLRELRGLRGKGLRREENEGLTGAARWVR